MTKLSIVDINPSVHTKSPISSLLKTITNKINVVSYDVICDVLETRKNLLMEEDNEQFNKLLAQYVFMVVKACVTDVDADMQDQLIKLIIDLDDDLLK